MSKQSLNLCVCTEFLSSSLFLVVKIRALDVNKKSVIIDYCSYMSLDEYWRRDVYISGIISLVLAILLSIFMGWLIITFGVRDMSILWVVVPIGVLWVIGIGCF